MSERSCASFPTSVAGPTTTGALSSEWTHGPSHAFDTERHNALESGLLSPQDWLSHPGKDAPQPLDRPPSAAPSAQALDQLNEHRVCAVAVGPQLDRCSPCVRGHSTHADPVQDSGGVEQGVVIIQVCHTRHQRSGLLNNG